jgi:hypothetical protein
LGDVAFVAVELTHIEQLTSNVCRSCDDVVSLLDVDGSTLGLGLTTVF